MADKSLLLLLDEVRGKTLRILQSVPSESTRWAPPGLQNTILWHAGHAFVLLECLTMTALELEPAMPEGWFEMFSWESRPAQVAADRWPALAEVIAALEAQQQRMASLIGGLSEEALDRPAGGNPKRTVRSAIVHALHDEACHSGEMYLLAKIKAVGKK